MGAGDLTTRCFPKVTSDEESGGGLPASTRLPRILMTAQEIEQMKHIVEPGVRRHSWGGRGGGCCWCRGHLVRSRVKAALSAAVRLDCQHQDANTPAWRCLPAVCHDAAEAARDQAPPSSGGPSGAQASTFSASGQRAA